MARGMTRSAPTLKRKYHRSPWYRLRLQLVILFFPLAGPFLAPLFSWIGIWPFDMIARFIYVLGDLFCPLPERAVNLAGYSTSVCPLCYGALLGLAMILLSFPLRPATRLKWERIPWQLQLALITAALIPWLSAYVANKAAWTNTPPLIMYLLGFPGGLAVGLLAYFVVGKEKTEYFSACSPRD